MEAVRIELTTLHRRMNRTDLNLKSDPVEEVRSALRQTNANAKRMLYQLS